jgi:hypothetical protein
MEMSTIFVVEEIIKGVTDAGAGFTATGATVTDVGALPEKRIVVAGINEVAGIVADVTPVGMVATLEFAVVPAVILGAGASLVWLLVLQETPIRPVHPETPEPTEPAELPLCRSWLGLEPPPTFGEGPETSGTSTRTSGGPAAALSVAAWASVHPD